LPLTALIDVVFLVVIFFMVNASFAVDASRALVTAIGVDLPDTASSEPAAIGTVVTITRGGRLLLERDGESRPVADARALQALLRVADPAAGVTIRGDLLIPYGQLVAIMDAARLAGIRNISLATDAVEPAEPR
jgi:biopolymer transport protein ExbD